MPALTELYILLPLLLLSGAAAGVLAGLLGIGGGLIIVPVLYHILLWLYGAQLFTMQLAVGTSLSTIILTSLVSACSHNRRGGVDWHLVRRWGGFVAGGAVLGTVAAARISSEGLRVIFACLLIGFATHLLYTATHSLSLFKRLPGNTAQSGMALTVGGLSSLLGIGGGTIVVSFLNLFSYPIHRAVATASVFGVFISVPGSAAYIIGGWGLAGLPPGSTGYVNWPAFAAIVPATMLCAPLGVKLAYHLNVSSLKRIFAVFLFVVAAKMLL